ncbi:hypothetical protein Tco_1546861 [Tanacetum coccineum]
MSDSEDSTITYTAVSIPFGGLSDIGSQVLLGPGARGICWINGPICAGFFTGPPSPDYIPGPEEPQSPPPPDFVPELVYPKFMPPEDEILPAEEQPLPAADSPTADSPGYIPESDPEEDPEEDDDKDPEEDPADYPADGGDDAMMRMSHLMMMRMRRLILRLMIWQQYFLFQLPIQDQASFAINPWKEDIFFQLTYG